MNLRDLAEQRMKLRAVCRVRADEIVMSLFEGIRTLPEEQQRVVLSMVMSELQAVLRKEVT